LYPVSRDQVGFYQRNGYVRLPAVLTPDEVRDLRKILSHAVKDRLKRVERGEITYDPRYEKVFVQMVNLWEEYPDINPFVHSLRLAEIARRLSRSRSVRLWHDHALIKPPKDGAETPWHQDFPYWPMNEPGALSCWLALDDVSEKNGCLSFVPETHKLGPLKPISLTRSKSIFKQAGLNKRTVKPAVMTLKAGGCTFHHGNLFHYAGPNLSSRSRRAIAIIYMPSGTTFNGASHIVTDGLGLKVGARFSGPKFPVLARR